MTDIRSHLESEVSFTFARSSGPGGQNVNKVNSKAILCWPVARSTLPLAVLNRFQAKFKNKINSSGDLILSSDSFRDQKRNQSDCLDRLTAMVLSVEKPAKRRKKTKPTKASVEKRLKQKSKRGDKKQLRRRPDID